jgi:hypothetical protein
LSSAVDNKAPKKGTSKGSASRSQRGPPKSNSNSARKGRGSAKSSK